MIGEEILVVQGIEAGMAQGILDEDHHATEVDAIVDLGLQDTGEGKKMSFV
jgi:hypothetical protein